jgi:cytochrome P450
MTDTEPVDDWSTDYDILSEEYARDPWPVWRELRDRCPIAHSERWGGSHLPTRYEDVQALAKMVPELSSSQPLVVPPPPEILEDPAFQQYGANSPPITSDPPDHGWSRRLLLPHFSPKAVQAHRPYTEALCDRLIDDFVDAGEVDGATAYAQQIPPRVIAHVLGIDESRVDDFVYWVRCILEFGLAKPELRIEYGEVIRNFFREVVAQRQTDPGDDLISHLVTAEGPDGEPIDPEIVVGMCNLQLIAGIDTTWSAIGSALWHLGTHPDDRRRLATAPELFPTAIEELLRAYSPVTMGRVVTEEVTYQGVILRPGDKVLMNFPGANHDPDVFENPDEVIIDRRRNRHIAFGSGIHRCAGSNLARMELDVALRSWFARIPEFEVTTPDEVTWAGGQVRGPRQLPIRFPV